MYYLIMNPAAGNGLAKSVCDEVKKVLKEKGIPFEVLVTRQCGHGEELAREAVRKNAEKILVIGGDGTVSEVVRGLNGTGVPMGIIPAGTGNDFIKTLQLPSEPMKALEVALTGRPRPTDAGVINGQAFANECGTGFDVSVLDYAQKAKKVVKGILPYLYGVICTIIHYKSTRLTYTLDDGREVTEDVLVFAAGNGRIIGGGICVCPEAVPDDGNFDVVIVRDVKRAKLPLYLVKLLMGKILTFPETVHMKARKIRFSCKGMRVNIDGEIQQMDSAELSLAAGGLSIVRP